jgi:MOSC domain-containing protein YiiM
MRIVSLNVGLPREMNWRGRSITTGIFKEPVDGPVHLLRHHLEGDGQADRSVHGGVDKAVYAYPMEHYDAWRGELPGYELRWGIFGENITAEGILETAVHIGDRFRVGSAEIEAAQPRLPCKKLNLRLDRDDMVERFLRSRRTGIYFRVLREGKLAVGSVLDRVHVDSAAVPIAEITRLYAFDKTDVDAMRRVLEVHTLPEKWRSYFMKRIDEQARSG